ncbi:hypothetical protein 10S11_21 [uncultured Caudovirales phage]|uniref:DUF7210 domain-containing protein n=1 Tax=uncultured Caudovirales phage TaxID=2100421 RepID=A0A2H4J325_9CAUD|nr:hypothetical protein 10S11_21 [uncultured Caudovirales phage]
MDAEKEILAKIDEKKEEKPKYIALVNLKYNKDIYKAGAEIDVLKKDTREMLDKNLIELK